ncbi:MAG: aminoglycoside phosphotransferase family protein [Anaerolineae bacterium]
MTALGEPIARGRTSELYAWGEGRVLKLFLSTYPRWWAEDEIRCQRAIAPLGLPTPVFYEACEEAGRPGMVLERLSGPTLLEELGSKPWRMGAAGRMLAELQARVHRVPAPEGLKTQRDWVSPGIIERDLLPAPLKSRVIAALQTLPDGPWLCHGDFHPGNIMLTPRGPMIIDWMTASCGLPAGDVARSSVLLSAGQVPPGTPMPGLVNLLRQWMHRAYLARYRTLSGIDQAQWHAWRAVMAANYLDVSVEVERPRLLALVSEELDEAAEA